MNTPQPLHCVTNGSQQKLVVWVATAILVPVMLSIFSTLAALTISSSQRISSLEAEFRELKANLVRIEASLDRLLERQP
jgi:hypothetical protein